MLDEKKLKIVLASGSATRKTMLTAAGIAFDSLPARVDEESVKASLLAEGARPRDVADTLAELKALKVSQKHPEALVLGSDQVLECEGRLFSKPETPEDCLRDLRDLRGKTHKLLSAAVVVQNGKPLWRFIGEARLTMREVSDPYLEDYVARNWSDIRHSVGGYQIEAEGVRLFSAISGDHFTILGLPLVPFLAWLSLRGDIPA